MQRISKKKIGCFVSAFIVLLIAIVLVSDKTQIDVFAVKGLDISKYKVAYFNVVEAKAKGKGIDGRDVFFIHQSIEYQLTDMGMLPFGIDLGDIPQEHPKESLIINCSISHGIGPPRIQRHGSVKTSFIKEIKISFTDVASKKEVISIRYRRSLCSNSERHCIHEIFNELRKTVGMSPVDKFSPDKETELLIRRREMEEAIFGKSSNAACGQNIRAGVNRVDESAKSHP